MDTLLHRKAALFTLAAIYTGFCAASLSQSTRIVFLIGAALLFLLCFLPRPMWIPTTAHKLIRILSVAVLCGTALVSLYADGQLKRNTDLHDNSTRSIVATIREEMYFTSYSAAYIADVSEIDGEGARLRILLETPETDLSVGDRIACTAALTQPEETDGTFPLRRYYASLGISLCAEAESVSLLETGTTPVRTQFAEWRSYLTAALRLALGRDGAALPAALLFGDRSLLPDSLTRNFQRLGISHLLAISGFHFAILLGAIEKLLSLFILRKKLRLIPLSAFALFYMALCSFAPSVLRAGIMMLFVYTAIALNRTSDMPTTLGVAVFLICLINPALFYSAALQLSTTAVLAIACFSHICRVCKPRKALGPLGRIGGKLLAPIALAMGIQWALLPLLCQYFGEISLLTPLTTVLFSPLIALILSLTPLLLLFRYVPFLATALTFAVNTLSDLTADLAGWIAQIPHATVSLHQNWAPYFALTVAVVFLLTPVMQRRKQILSAMCAILCLCGLAGVQIFAERQIHADEVTITATVRGTNEAILVSENGKLLLCDLSNGSYTSINHAYAAAKKAGATEIHALLLTHLHKRHVQSFERISDTAYVRMLILPTPETEAESEIVLSLKEIAENKNIPVGTYTRGETGIFFYNTTILADTEMLSRSTHPILGMRLSAHGQEVVYIGASAGEKMRITTEELSCVIFGIHGPIYKEPFHGPQGGAEQMIFRGNAYEFASDSLKSTAAAIPTTVGDSTVRLCVSPSSKDS